MVSVRAGDCGVVDGVMRELSVLQREGDHGTQTLLSAVMRKVVLVVCHVLRLR